MNSYYTGNAVTVSGIEVPGVSVRTGMADFLGAVMVRWGINRGNYMVSPGLYSVGEPGQHSDVFVTANYKLSFDALRRSLSGLDGWIMVLDTKGINVWCAAGKGTFGTGELVRRIKSVSLEKIVSHRRVIVPQLGATGVAAHKVREETGFNVHYGPVRASDIREFIGNGYRASEEMRKVRFGLTDRLKLIPNDLIYGRYYLLGAIALLYVLSGVSRSGLSYRDFASEGGQAILKVFAAYLAGIVMTPALLPYIPGRYFSLKGILSGAFVYLCFLLLDFSHDNLIETVSWFFIITAISSFLAMNFTGSSTFTSLSGVKKEMKLFIPVQIGFAVTGLILQVIGKLI